MYRVVLKARKNGSWVVMFFDAKKRLWTLPFRRESAATWTAAKLCDEMKQNSQEFGWDVQDEHGKTIRSVNLARHAWDRK